MVASAAPLAPARCVDRAGAVLGEGPVWVAAEQALYWVDIKGLRLHRFDPATGAARSWPTPFRIGAIAPRAQGGFVGAGESGFLFIDPAMSAFSVIDDPEGDLPGNRFNDGKVDAQGRFWAGTMDDAEVETAGSLYRLDGDLRWSRQDTGYKVPNGPAFGPDGRSVYHSDSAARTIFRFTLAADGTLRNKAVFARFGPADGYPDGMAVDEEGCVWVAFWDGWCVRRLSPEGETLSVLELPVQRPTSCTFGGPALDQLLVTSAAIGLDQAALAAQPLAGGLFVAAPGVRGAATPPFAG